MCGSMEACASFGPFLFFSFFPMFSHPVDLVNQNLAWKHKLWLYSQRRNGRMLAFQYTW